MKLTKLRSSLSLLLFVAALHLMPRTQVVPCPEGETCEEQSEPEGDGNQSASE